MADGEIRAQRKVLRGGFIKFFKKTFRSLLLADHEGLIVEVVGPERCAPQPEKGNDRLLVRAGKQQLWADRVEDEPIDDAICLELMAELNVRPGRLIYVRQGHKSGLGGLWVYLPSRLGKSSVSRQSESVL